MLLTSPHASEAAGDWEMVNSKSQKTVLLLCGDYMEDHEVMYPFQALLVYGVSIVAVCSGKKAGDICRTAVHQPLGHQTYFESWGHNFTLNTAFDETEIRNMTGLVIPGGWAPECLAMDSFVVVDIVRKSSNSQKPIASICHGQLILAAADVVKDCKCIAFPAVRSALIVAGAFWVEPENNAASVVDGNIITTATYGGHPEFIQPFVKAVGGIITGADKYSVSL